MAHFAQHYNRAPALAAAAAATLCLAISSDGAELDTACRSALGSRSGAIVVLDVRTGGLLGSARLGPLAAGYPAGSVAKLACAHAGLLSEAISTRTEFICRGAADIGGSRYHCTVPGGHGKLKLRAAVSKSCNIWFYQASAKVPAAATMRSWRMLGVAGASGSSRAVDAAVGRGGPTVTPMQMAQVAATIARASDNAGSHCAELAAAMREAVGSGTATALGRASMSCAVKTGSPEHVSNSNKRHGWVVGFAPEEKPEYAFAVFCLEGNAFRSAVPVTRLLLDRIARERSK